MIANLVYVIVTAFNNQRMQNVFLVTFKNLRNKYKENIYGGAFLLSEKCNFFFTNFML